MIERVAQMALLAAGALLSSCGEAAVPENKAVAVRPQAPTAPEAAAERLVRARLGSGDVRFEGARAYRSGGVAVVCGAYSQPGRPHQRFVAVSDVDVWIEPDMAPGQMDRAFAEFCKDGSADA